MRQPTQFSVGVRLWHSFGKVNLKRHVVRKNGKEHVYYSLSETIRVNKVRTVQRRVLIGKEYIAHLLDSPENGAARIRPRRRVTQ